MHKLITRFEISIDDKKMKEMLEKKGHTVEEFEGECIELLREDLEEQLGSDWEPFVRGPFEIELVIED